jgi:MHS family alpha-ketoglutarate permease-like MFS transporter
MHETEAFEATIESVPSRRALRGLLDYPREVALVIGLTAGGTAAFYTFTTYMQTFVRQTVGLSATTTTYVIAGSLIFATVLQPLYGALSDRIGRKPLLIAFGLGGALLTVPILTVLQNTSSAWIALLLLCGAWLFIAGYTSINAIVKAELFPTRVRATGVAVPYALTVSIFGGTAPAIALALKNAGREHWFFYYLAGMIFVSLLVYLLMRDTKVRSAMQIDG